MRISPNVFAEVLAQSMIHDDLKQRILEELPKMSSQKIRKIYRILQHAQSRQKQEQLKMEVHMANEWKVFQENLQEIMKKLETFS